MILDPEKTTHTVAARDALCRRINVPVEKYTVVLDGLVDTDAAYCYAPDVVERVRRLRAERFAFERRQGRWKSFVCDTAYHPGLGFCGAGLLGTGVRIGELLAIRWDDVDLEATPPTISVMGTVTLGADGGGMQYQLAPKSETSKRILYLPTIAAEILRRQFEDREFRSESEAVFASETGTWRDPSNYRAHFRQVRKIAKLDWETSKTIHKTVVTTIYTADGMDDASQQLGHSEVGATAKHYVQRLIIDPACVIGALDEWLQSAS
ncbi:tyrosine-type recombinase/integrase [Brevibacterium spongiae]|uniref:Tyrosine-type recombinase/integrase n=1 Tax=Brevibacterium spongiae TaxID=2909672 RepID=A0ABY5SR59_9MICO|nr:tyrosine-type recombinase/integrase [Brevibacterium spongiae]UVI37037.1 tyrosine-type recombinase/integrase [Brevibacterium spongiae]